MARPRQIKTIDNPRFTRVDIDKICGKITMCNESEHELREYLERLI